jgi:hypothetical protein
MPTDVTAVTAGNVSLQPTATGPATAHALLASPVASVTAAEVSRQFNLVKVGELKQVSERYYIAIAPGRDEHPLVASLLERLSSGKALLHVPATRSAVAHD